MDIDDILNGDYVEPDVSEVNEIEPNEEKHPELMGINNAEIIRAYSDLKLQVVEIDINEETQYEAVEYTKRLKKLSNFIDKVRKDEKARMMRPIIAMEKPYNDLKALVNKFVRDLQGSLTDFQKEQRRKEQERLEAERQAELERAEARKRDLEEAKEDAFDAEEAAEYEEAIEDVSHGIAVIESKPVPVANANVSAIGATAYLKKSPKYEITDKAAVPREYCEPSKGLIWNAVRAGVREIPGVRIWEDENTAIR